MALRVLTDTERQALQGSSTFLEKAQWAIRNYASYWSAHDGSGLNGNQLIKWAKDRMLSVNIVLNDISDPSIALKFVKISKGMQFDLGPAPVNTDAIIDAFTNANKFEECASSYFDLQGEAINFSLTGN